MSTNKLTHSPQVQLNVRYIALTLLHQNLTHASVKGELTPPLVTLSNNYFTEIAEVVTNNYTSDASSIRTVLNKVGYIIPRARKVGVQ